VLVPIAAGSEPVEATVPIDVLRRAGADVTVAAAGGGGLLVDAMYGVKIVADASVADCADASYDLVALPVRRSKAQWLAHAPVRLAFTLTHSHRRLCREGSPARPTSATAPRWRAS